MIFNDLRPLCFAWRFGVGNSTNSLFLFLSGYSYIISHWNDSGELNCVKYFVTLLLTLNPAVHNK